jgi:UDP-glucose 4-epimerase
LAFVHAEAVEALEQRDSLVSNVGSGEGVSVRQMVAAVERILGKPLRVKIQAPREGDPPRLVADNTHFLTWSTLGRRGFTPLATSVHNTVRSLSRP